MGQCALTAGCQSSCCTCRARQLILSLGPVLGLQIPCQCTMRCNPHDWSHTDAQGRTHRHTTPGYSMMKHVLPAAGNANPGLLQNALTHSKTPTPTLRLRLSALPYAGCALLGMTIGVGVPASSSMASSSTSTHMGLAPLRLPRLAAAASTHAGSAHMPGQHP